MATHPGQGMVWQRLLTMALVSTCAWAGDGAPANQARTPLAYAAGAGAETGLPPGWASAFQATVAQDLRQAGVFQLIEPPARPTGVEAAALTLETLLRPTLHGKVLVECRCSQVEGGRLVFDKKFVGGREALARMAHRVADFTVGKVTGTAGVAESEMVFSRRTGPGSSEIFEVDRDGQNLHKVTAFGSFATHPALAADGRLALVTFKGGPPQIWAQVRPFGPLQRLYPSQAQGGMGISDLAWSPDGTRLAFILENSKGAAGLHILELASGKVACLTSPEHRAKSPSWNPQGTALVYVSDEEGLPQVFRVDAAGGKPSQVTHDPVPKHEVAWAPDGARIAYVVHGDGRSSLLTIKPDGTARQPLGSLGQSVESLGWAPDGRCLLLGLKQANTYQIATMDLEGVCLPFAEALSGGQCPQWTRTHPRLASLPLADSPASHPDHAPLSPSSHS